MVFVWIQEGALLPTDRTMLAAGVKWLLGSCVLVGAAWWLRRKIGNKTGDNSFRLVQSKSGHLEKVVQNVFLISCVVLLAIWLWPRVPGSAIMKVPAVAGWLVAGFLGSHALHRSPRTWTFGRRLARRLRSSKNTGRRGTCALVSLLRQRSARAVAGLAQHGLYVCHSAEDEGIQSATISLVAAGPLANLIVLWVTYQLITRAFGGLVAAFDAGPGGLMVFALFWWTALAAREGLVPHKVRSDHQEVWSDGYWLLRLWTGSGADITELARSSNWREPWNYCQSDCPPAGASGTCRSGIAAISPVPWRFTNSERS